MSRETDRRAIKKAMEDGHRALERDTDLQEWAAQMVNRFLELPADYVFARRRELEAIVRDATQAMGIHAASAEQRGLVAGSILHFDGFGESESDPASIEPGDLVSG